jgi:hypothetical protein
MKPLRSTNIARIPSVIPLSGGVEHGKTGYVFNGLLRRRQPGLQSVVQPQVGEQHHLTAVGLEPTAAVHIM